VKRFIAFVAVRRVKLGQPFTEVGGPLPTYLLALAWKANAARMLHNEREVVRVVGGESGGQVADG
jgi:hypothetical protein